ncbi:MAG: TonB-dependent receptor [Acidobacteria bacterium]|nr:TonB-dependent receptor [Acidobacteriota bacterium]
MKCSCKMLLILLVMAAAVRAQSVSGQISGTVFDASGAVVPGAEVTVRQTATGNTRKFTSNESGYYVAADLLPGLYEVGVEKAGFKRYVEAGINLSANMRITVNGTLSPGAATEIVQVTATANQVETSTGEINSVVSGRQVTELSLNGRNYIQLLQLIPGVTVDYTSGFDLASNTGAQHVNGLRGNTSGLMVDGAWNLNVGSNSTPHVNPSVDSIAEVKITTGGFSAEHGHAQGAQINVVTRSGGREFHGGLFEFVRNDAFDAKDWISNRSGTAKPPLRFNDFGGNLGVPVYIPNRWNRDRSKAFFFLSLTGRRNTRATTRTGIVPAAEEREGDFRNSTLPIPMDPRTRQPLNPSNPRLIPRNLWSRNGPPLLAPLPLPNIQGQGFNFVNQTAAKSHQDEQIYRFDYNLSDRTQLFIRGVRDKFDLADSSNGSALGIVGNVNDRRGVIWSLNASHTFSPTTVNVFNFSWSGTRISNLPITRSFTRDKLGLTYPELFPGNVFNAAPDVAIQGYTGYGVGSNLETFHHMFLWRDDFSMLRGNHALKFGVWVERYRANANVLQGAPRQNGQVTFNRSSSLSTGNIIADVLVGNFQSYAESSDDSVVWGRYTQLELYAQDNWRIRPNFSVEYGLRYVISPPIGSALNNTIAFRPELYDPAKAPRFNADGSLAPGSGDFIGGFYVNGLSLPGKGWPEAARGRVPSASNPEFDRLFRGVPPAVYTARYNNFGPRVSFAWDPSGAGNWSIRGGGGISYDRIRNGSTILTGSGVPFLVRSTVFDANLDQPGAGRAGPLFPSAVTSFASLVKTPTVYSYSFGFERRLGASLLAEARYVGTLARYITMGVNPNELPLGTRLRPGNATVPRDALRPFPGIADITLLTAQGASNYHGLQTSLERRLTSGLQLGMVYTWSKVITNATTEQSIGGIQNAYDLRAERGLADYDRTHVLVFHYIWQLPVFRQRKDWAGKALGGWDLSGITSFTSGSRASPTFSLAGDPTGTGKTSMRPDFVASVRYLDPRQTRSFRLPNGATVTGNFWFDPTASFALPPAGLYGNSAPNVIRGPGMNNWDVSLFKNIPLNDRIRLQFRAEFFNFFNHTSFSGISASLPATNTSSTFGQVTAVAPARITQLGLKLAF